MIGVGIAGLTAATAPTHAGVECVVLEARDRIGGRLHTADPAARLSTWAARQARSGRLHGGDDRGVRSVRGPAATSWAADPWAGGAYTHIPPGASAADADLLGEPVGGRLLFAGEHTRSARLAYADGALSSGIREAKRLLGTPAVRLAANHALKRA